jgi:hypothetical protein
MVADFQIGAASVVSIQKNGLITTGGSFGGGLSVRTGGVTQAIIGMHTVANANGVHLSSTRPITWSSGQAGSNAVDTSLNVQAGGTVQIGTTVSNALGSLACATITTTGSITSTFQSLSADPAMGTDLLAGQTRIIKNTSTGVIKSWVNDGGVAKSVTYV